MEIIPFDRPEYVHPVHGSIVSTRSPEITWTPVTDASFYRVRIYTGTSDTIHLSPELLGISYIVPENILLSGREYSYRIHAYKRESNKIVCSSSTTSIAGDRPYFTVSTVDSDNDGLLDSIENSSACLDSNDADTDDDGIPDGIEDENQNGIMDAGETNPCNIDTDGDGIKDGTELGYTFDDIGSDTDTSVFIPDADNTTVTNPLESDTDGDGFGDGQEDSNYNGQVDIGERDPNQANVRGLPFILLLLD